MVVEKVVHETEEGIVSAILSIVKTVQPSGASQGKRALKVAKIKRLAMHFGVFTIAGVYAVFSILAPDFQHRRSVANAVIE